MSAIPESVKRRRRQLHAQAPGAAGAPVAVRPQPTVIPPAPVIISEPVMKWMIRNH